MSIFTGGELEFLAGLDRRWRTLYWRELARLLRRDAAAGVRHDPAAVRAPDLRRPTAKILVLAPELRGCAEEAACPFRRRRHAPDEGARPRVAAPR